MAVQVQENKKNDEDLKNKQQEAAKELGKIVSAAKTLYSKLDQDQNGTISLGEIKEIVMPSAKKGQDFGAKASEDLSAIAAKEMPERRDWAAYRDGQDERGYLSQNRVLKEAVFSSDALGNRDIKFVEVPQPLGQPEKVKTLQDNVEAKEMPERRDWAAYRGGQDERGYLSQNRVLKEAVFSSDALGNRDIKFVEVPQPLSPPEKEVGKKN